MTALAVPLLAVAGVMQAASARKAGAQARAQGEYAGNVQEQNALLAEINADDALARGTLDENQLRGTVKGILGAQRTGYAGSGVDLSSGSVADVTADTALQGEVDALRIRNNAKFEQWGYQVEAAQLRSGATMSRQAGRSQQSSANLAAVGSLLTTGVQLYGAYRKKGG